MQNPPGATCMQVGARYRDIVAFSPVQWYKTNYFLWQVFLGSQQSPCYQGLYCLVFLTGQFCDGGKFPALYIFSPPFCKDIFGKTSGASTHSNTVFGPESSLSASHGVFMNNNTHCHQRLNLCHVACSCSLVYISVERRCTSREAFSANRLY